MGYFMVSEIPPSARMASVAFRIGGPHKVVFVWILD